MKSISVKKVIVFLVFFSIVTAIIFSFNKGRKKVTIKSFENMNIEDVKKYSKENNIDYDVEYEYSDTIKKDVVIKQENNKDNIVLIVSKGTISDEEYKNNNINELGNVPIMMYHGIIDLKNDDTKYTGGNVDRDGYKRTTEAFRKDLEFYYSEGYRMIRLEDYVNGKIDVEFGKSPIILTFDDGDENNFKVLGKDKKGNLKIDPNCAVGILESYKEKYPDFNVTATFFVMDGLFNQSEYNNDILNWLVNNGYDVGNHTKSHPDFTKISSNETDMEIGYMYNKLDSIIKDKYVNIVALPYGSPYKKEHENFSHILSGNYEGKKYDTQATLRVGWTSEVSPFNKNFDKTFLKRIRAYDNDGKEFDIQMTFNSLKSTKYISDGNINKIVIPDNYIDKLGDTSLTVKTYK